MPPLVSVLILAHNKAAHTRRCLDGMFASTCDSVQFVFVDNGSTDETPDVFRSFAERAGARGWTVDTMTLNENIGAVSGRNRGLPLLTGEHVVIMDNDVTPRTRGWMETLVAFLRANPDVGVVQPKMIYPVAPHRIQCAGCDVSPTGKVNFRGRGAARGDPAFAKPRDCQALISACWMLPRAVIDELGPLDEQFDPIQFEDIDYCYRVRESGRRAVYVPDVEMYHFENVTSGGTARMNYTYLTMKNNHKFCKKWQHRFRDEGGPPAASMEWAEIEPVHLSDVGDLEQL